MERVFINITGKDAANREAWGGNGITDVTSGEAAASFQDYILWAAGFLEDHLPAVDGTTLHEFTNMIYPGEDRAYSTFARDRRQLLEADLLHKHGKRKGATYTVSPTAVDTGFATAVRDLYHNVTEEALLSILPIQDVAGEAYWESIDTFPVQDRSQRTAEAATLEDSICQAAAVLEEEYGKITGGPLRRLAYEIDGEEWSYSTFNRYVNRLVEDGVLHKETRQRYTLAAAVEGDGVREEVDIAAVVPDSWTPEEGTGQRGAETLPDSILRAAAILEEEAGKIRGGPLRQLTYELEGEEGSYSTFNRYVHQLLEEGRLEREGHQTYSLPADTTVMPLPADDINIDDFLPETPQEESSENREADTLPENILRAAHILDEYEEEIHGGNLRRLAFKLEGKEWSYRTFNRHMQDVREEGLLEKTGRETYQLTEEAIDTVNIPEDIPVESYVDAATPDTEQKQRAAANAAETVPHSILQAATLLYENQDDQEIVSGPDIIEVAHLLEDKDWSETTMEQYRLQLVEEEKLEKPRGSTSSWYAVPRETREEIDLDDAWNQLEDALNETDSGGSSVAESLLEEDTEQEDETEILELPQEETERAVLTAVRFLEPFRPLPDETGEIQEHVETLLDEDGIPTELIEEQLDTLQEQDMIRNTRSGYRVNDAVKPRAQETAVEHAFELDPHRDQREKYGREQTRKALQYRYDIGEEAAAEKVNRLEALLGPNMALSIGALNYTFQDGDGSPLLVAENNRINTALEEHVQPNKIRSELYEKRIDDRILKVERGERRLDDGQEFKWFRYMLNHQKIKEFAEKHEEASEDEDGEDAEQDIYHDLSEDVWKRDREAATTS